MDTISSTEFRKRFASLERVTVVTVNGHVLGEWHPMTKRREDYAASKQISDPTLSETMHQIARITDMSRPFTPAPKPVRRK